VLARPASPGDVAVIVVVGGPQYRIGSQRQFVRVARELAASGVTCMRFDYRGMGDSEGTIRSFDSVTRDVAAAIEATRTAVPSVSSIVLWGLCDGASAALIAAPLIPTVRTIIALNPHIRSEVSLNRALVRHYYVERLLTRGFWRKFAQGQLELRRYVAEFAVRLVSAASSALWSSRRQGTSDKFQDSMLAGLKALPDPCLLVLSGRDLTAQEFDTYCRHDREWSAILADARRIKIVRFPEADHTFSEEPTRSEMVRLTKEFVLSLTPSLVSRDRAK
jgi:exosortase A-associated hydrolase 1